MPSPPMAASCWKVQKVIIRVPSLRIALPLSPMTVPFTMKMEMRLTVELEVTRKTREALLAEMKSPAP